VSLEYYSTALVWHTRRGGSAKLWGRIVPLLDAPPLAGLRLVMVEYLPEIAQRELQEVAAPRHEMTLAEVAAVDAFLRALLER